jgi:hypothetical protein
MVGLGCGLALATFLFGDSAVHERTNSLAVMSASTFFLIRFMADSSGESKNPEAADFAVIRWGLLIFLAFVVWQNLMEFFPTSLPQLEPFGFAAFLGTLGFVAARRSLRRDQQLKEIQNERTGGSPSHPVIHSAKRIPCFHELPSSRPVWAHEFRGGRSLRLHHCG